MEELLEIILALIGKLMAAPKPPPSRSGRPPMLPSTPQIPSGHAGAAYKPIPGARAVPPSRAAVKPKAAPARRRRPQPPPLMAAPIITGQAADAAPPAARTTVSKPVASAQATKAPAPLDAAAFHRWLKPATLRQQFLLTEIFQPPLALRDPCQPQHQ